MFQIDPPRKNSCHILASQPFQQRLQHIQFGKCSLQESNSSKSPKSTTYCDTHNFKNRISRRKVLRALTSHPSQPLFTTYIFSKTEPLAEFFSETQQVTQVNHCLQHIYFPKMNLSQKFLQDSTSQKNRIQASQPRQPIITTHIISKIESLAKCFCEP